ncbi:ATP-binding cassette domain-containing protein [Alsobacter sp. SYSU M60028]|uniref:ATP-binding cassette domain-containing protein n=1 Tax=Alsobacter ponti TaxID=2962936 RepID=A0ABT1LDY2_9HYPH|nr:oligopeptide/dipeptide ABC transporter ATP-binding protein [Alsobacter ponti]MCP8939639.1 ATP-binding cassette domain-containing protein [Alsobacter ponti]
MTPLIEGRGLTRRFTRGLDVAEKLARALGANIREEVVHAVEGVDIAIRQGEVFGLVGESGCGKSTLGRVLAGILPPTDGELLWRGRDVAGLSRADRLEMRLAVQMIFQDPMSSLNPRKRVIDLIGEAPRVHGLVRAGEVDDYVASLMQRVGLDPAYRRRYPHQFSGGQRQRIGIARALAVRPKLIVCDESVSALDVSIQAQVINLFMDLREELDLTYLFISHDLGVVKHISDRVGIMYLGRVVETAGADDFFAAPNHPYTVALLKELPSVKDRRRDFTPIRGEIPSPLDPPPGCAFHPRCPRAMPVCSADLPALKPVAAAHWSACHLNDMPALRPASETAA